MPSWKKTSSAAFASPSIALSIAAIALTLLGYAGNQLLLEIVTELRNKTRLLGLVPLLESGRLVESAEEHQTIMDLVEAGQADRAEAFLRRHIGHVRGLWAAHPEE